VIVRSDGGVILLPDLRQGVQGRPGVDEEHPRVADGSGRGQAAQAPAQGEAVLPEMRGEGD